MLRLAIESWIWYGVVMAIITLRFVSRTLHLGSIKKLQLDDFIIIFIVCTYTTFLASINIVANTHSNLLPPGFDITTLTDSEIRERQYGSKMVLVVEQCQCLTVWAVKACLLLLYYRLTHLRPENLLLRLLAAYVAFGFVFMEVFYLAVWCRPFNEYWAIPSSSTQCTAATNHLITNAVFNISSDLAMLAIALPMFIRSKLPAKQKWSICGVFGLGLFVILSAALNKYYSFTQPYSSMWTYWYVRESSTAVLVANLPFTWHLIRRILRHDGSEGSGVPTCRTGRAPSDDRQSDITKLPAVHMFTAGPEIESLTHNRRYDSYASDKSYAALLGGNDVPPWRDIEYEGPIVRSSFHRRGTDGAIDLDGPKIEMVEFPEGLPIPHDIEGFTRMLFGRESILST